MHTPPALSDLARAALELARAEGYSVSVEPCDGPPVTLLRGRPGRALVIVLAPPAPRPVVAELQPVRAEQLAA